ncbi:efflux RND transporter permease subunit [Albimonas sp. CAU 1670]|uniref:efflux RND transporter permease subunit n=1 Tax=Albimonas sp. CAU 1670 TaxID=3032599 RepID=UPI0023D9FF73|nr:efflux RND transporter permease subunit [Albimonas sp. CAU 1670]MDF2234883.1 efflux RND transporter permease subunit [Albimonas sp. CAU 1670]
MRTLFFRQARLTALVILVLVAAGASAFLTIGRQEDPTITNLFANIFTPYPGADPARVEALVTEKIEAELREIPEIKRITSTSSTGMSVLNVELSEFLDDAAIDIAWSDIRQALRDVARELPEGVPEPEFDDDRTGAFSAISALMPRDADVPPAILARHAEMLEDRLRALSGVSLVSSYGMPEEEVLVTVDPDALGPLGLSAAQVAAAISQADPKVSAGRLRGAATDLLIEVSGEIRSLDRVREIPLATNAEGFSVRVGDVATVEKTARVPAPSLARVDGRPAVLVAAKMEEGRQVDAWIRTVKAALADYEASLPGGLEHRLIFDQSGYTADRLSEVAMNMAVGVGLVVAVLFLTLGFRAALVVAAVLPLVGLATLATLNFMGIPIHQMSVTGMIVALGLLVDAAIVMTDEIRRRLAAGMPRVEAVGDAVGRLAAPLLASTVTTALTFMPMILLPGPAGDFVGTVAISVVAMLAWSFVIAMTVTPALSGWLLPDPSKGGGIVANGISGAAFGRLFAGSLRLATRNPVPAVAWALVLPVMGFLAFPSLTPQFFPGVDRDQFYIDVEMPSGAAVAATEATSEAISQALASEDGIRQVAWVIGESAPSFYYNMTMNKVGVPGFARALVTTESNAATARLVPHLQRTLPAVAPGARILVRDLVQGPPVQAPVELRLHGDDLALLRATGDAIRGIIESSPDIASVQTTMEGGAPKLDFALDEDKARLAGLDLVSVARQLDAALEGVVGGSLVEGSEELPVRVRVGAARRADAAFVETFEVVAPDGRLVPLSTLGEMRVVPSDSAISRRDGERVNTVAAFVRYGVLPEAALAQAQRLLDEAGFEPPQGVRLEVGGDADARNEVIQNLMAPLGLIVTLSIATVVLTFNSFRLGAVATVVMVLSAGLSILSLAICGYPFGITAVVGVIGSIGVSVNACIIILTALQEDPRAAAGDRDAMAEVVLGASRHIVSTTVTTFGGFLPLILGGGGFWPPFAMSIAGGVLLSTVVSFYFTPPMFALVARRATPAGQGAPVPPEPEAARPALAALPSRPAPAQGNLFAAE